MSNKCLVCVDLAYPTSN